MLGWRSLVLNLGLLHTQKLSYLEKVMISTVSIGHRFLFDPMNPRIGQDM